MSENNVYNKLSQKQSEYPMMVSRQAVQVQHAPRMFCGHCGQTLPSDNAYCPYCGAPANNPGAAGQNRQNNIIINNIVTQQAPVRYAPVPGEKDWLTTLLLCIFLGVLGVHRFYVGKIGTGLIWLLTAGLWGIGWIVDIILIATRAFRDANGNPLA